MAATQSCDVTKINDEDVLRRMWQETEDFGRKKEIRAHMYKMREARLKEFYSSGEVGKDIQRTNSSPGLREQRKGATSTHHADSLLDHSFLSLKSKEIRDSESPTRDITYKINDKLSTDKGWTVRETNEKSTDGKMHSTSRVATTSGTDKLDDGVCNYAAKNEQKASVYHDGDDKNFTKSVGASNKSVIQQEAHGGDDNSKYYSTSTTSKSSSKYVTEQKSSSGDGPVQQSRITDVTSDYKKHPNYIEGKTKVYTETKTLPDGSTVTTTRYETTGGRSSQQTATSSYSSTSKNTSEHKSTKSEQNVGTVTKFSHPEIDERNVSRYSDQTSTSKIVTDRSDRQDFDRRSTNKTIRDEVASKNQEMSSEIDIKSTNKVIRNEVDRSQYERNDQEIRSDRQDVDRRSTNKVIRDQVETTQYDVARKNQDIRSEIDIKSTNKVIRNQQEMRTARQEIDTHKITRDEYDVHRNQDFDRKSTNKTIRDDDVDRRQFERRSQESRNEFNTKSTTKVLRDEVGRRQIDIKNHEIRNEKQDFDRKVVNVQDTKRVVENIENNIGRTDVSRAITPQMHEDVSTRVIKTTVGDKRVISEDFINVERQHLKDTRGSPVKTITTTTTSYEQPEHKQHSPVKPTTTPTTTKELDARGSPVLDQKPSYEQPERRQPIKPGKSEMETKRTPTDGQYDTTYRSEFTNKRISVDVSPTHDAFARSLRSVTPERERRSPTRGSTRTSTTSLRSSTSPDKRYPDRREGSPRKYTRSPDKFASNETITKTTTSKTTRKSPQRTYSTDTITKRDRTYSTETITKRDGAYNTDTITRRRKLPEDVGSKKTVSRSRSSSPTDTVSDFEFRRVDQVTDLDDVVVTEKRPTDLDFTGPRKPKKVTDRSPTSPLTTPTREPPQRRSSLKSPSKEFKPFTSRNDKVLRRTDTYEERCRQILGITERKRIEKNISDILFSDRNRSKSPEKKYSPTKEEPRRNITGIRKGSKDLPREQGARSPTKDRVRTTEVPSQIRKSPERRRSPTKEAPKIAEFPSQIRKSPEKVDRQPYPERRSPSKEAPKIKEFPSQIRRSPERQPKEPYPTRRSPIKEGPKIAEFPSQIRKSPERVQREPRPERRSPSKERPQSRKSPTKEGPMIAEFPSQIRMSPERISREPYPSRRSPTKESPTIAEFPSQVRRSPEQQPREPYPSRRSPTKEGPKIAEFPSQIRKSPERVQREPYPERRSPSKDAPKIEEFPSQIRKSPEKQTIEPYPSRRSPTKEGPTIAEFPSQIRKTPETVHREPYPERSSPNKEPSKIQEFPSQIRRSPLQDDGQECPSQFRRTLEKEEREYDELKALQKKTTKVESYDIDSDEEVEISQDIVVKDVERYTSLEDLTRRRESPSPIRQTKVAHSRAVPDEDYPERELFEVTNKKVKPTDDTFAPKKTHKPTEDEIVEIAKRFIEGERVPITEEPITKKFVPKLYDDDEEETPKRQSPDRVSPVRRPTHRKTTDYLVNERVDFEVRKSPERLSPVRGIPDVKNKTVKKDLSRKSNETTKTKKVCTTEYTDSYSRRPLKTPERVIKIANKPSQPKFSSHVETVTKVKGSKLNVVTLNGDVRPKPKTTPLAKKPSLQEFPAQKRFEKQTPERKIKPDEKPTQKTVRKEIILNVKATKKPTEVTTKRVSTTINLSPKAKTPTPTTKTVTPTFTKYTKRPPATITTIKTTRLAPTITIKPKTPKSAAKPIQNGHTYTDEDSDIEVITKTTETQNINLVEAQKVFQMKTTEAQKVFHTQQRDTKKALHTEQRETEKVFQTEPRETENVLQIQTAETQKVVHVKPTEVQKVIHLKPNEPQKVLHMKPTEPQKVLHMKPTKEPVKQKPKLEKKCVSTKSIIINETVADEREIIVDLQRSKSSREETPDRVWPVSTEEDSGIPRYPDQITEPEDLIHKLKKINDIPLNEDEDVNEFSRISEMVDVKITEADRVQETDECLLTVNEKVSKFLNTADRLNKKPKSSGPAPKVVRPKLVVDENLQSDECLLSVSDKVNKFITSAEKLTVTDMPERPKSPRCQNFMDIHETSNVSEKVTHFTFDDDEELKPKGVAPKQQRPDLNVGDDLRADECLLSVSDKVHKFIASAEQLTTTKREKSPPPKKSILKNVSPIRDVKDKTVHGYTNVKSEQEVTRSIQSEVETTREDCSTVITEDDMNKPYNLQQGLPKKEPVTERKHKQFESEQVIRDNITSTTEDIVNKPHTPKVFLQKEPAPKRFSNQYESEQVETTITTEDTISKPYHTPQIIKKQATSKRVSTQFESDQYNTSIHDCSTITTEEDMNTPQGPKVAPKKEPAPKRDSKHFEPDSTPKSTRKPDERLTTTSTTRLRSTESIKKARALFETTESDHKPKQKDILTRPSVFESRKTVEHQQKDEVKLTDIGIERKHHLDEVRKKLNYEETTRKSVSPQRDHLSPNDDDSIPGYMRQLDRSLRAKSPHIESVHELEEISKGHIPHPHEDASKPNKFGVVLKKTDSETKLERRRSSTVITEIDGVKKEVEVEEIYDLELLEIMLERVVGYELRRRVRAQIRLVKKLATENKIHTVTTKKVTKTKPRYEKSPEKVVTKPITTKKDNKLYQHSDIVTEKDTTQRISEYQTSYSFNERRRSSETRKTPTRESPVRSKSPRKSPSPDKSTDFKPFKSKSPERKVFTPDLKRTATSPKTVVDDKPEWVTQKVLKKVSDKPATKKTTTTSTTTTTKKESQKRVHPTKSTDVITSSYGVGPTDEYGSPLFGLRALRTQHKNENTKVQGTVMHSTFYSENGKEPVGEISVTKYSTDPKDLGSTEDLEHKDGLLSKTTTQKYGYKDTPSYKTITDNKRLTDKNDELRTSTTTTTKVTRRGSVKEMSQKFLDNAVETLKSERQSSYPKAGLILRSSSFKGSSDSSREGSPPAVERDEEHRTITVKTSSSTSTGKSDSFLSNTSKVTGVQDVISRMKTEDYREEDTAEDAEARTLLNKFLGSQVLLAGMEGHMQQQQRGSSTKTSASTSSSSTSKRVTKVTSTITENGIPKTTTRTYTHPITADILETVWDEQTLRLLLEQSTEYEERRIIRARLKQVMAEKEACSDFVDKTIEETQSGNVQEKVETTRKTFTEGPLTKTQVTTRVSSQQITKKPMSPFAKFRQLDKQNSLNTPPSTPKTPTSGGPLFKFTDPNLSRSASTIKERLLQWCQMKTKEYENIKLDNFSTSWADGLAFCALVHHFIPDAFDYHQLTPNNRRHNFTLAFQVADEKADIAPLLDVEDMVATRRPDWKCVFTYVQSIYRRFKDED